MLIKYTKRQVTSAARKVRYLTKNKGVILERKGKSSLVLEKS